MLLNMTKFVRSNPPLKFLKEVVEKNTMADVAQAEFTPLVVIGDVEIDLIVGRDNAKTANLKKEEETYRLSTGKSLANLIAIHEAKATIRKLGSVRPSPRKWNRHNCLSGRELLICWSSNQERI